MPAMIYEGCGVCLWHAECLDHLFVHIKVVSPLWYKAFKWESMSIPFSQSILEVFHDLGRGKKS